MKREKYTAKVLSPHRPKSLSHERKVNYLIFQAEHKNTAKYANFIWTCKLGTETRTNASLSL